MISESLAVELLNSHLTNYCKRLKIDHWEIKTKYNRLDGNLMATCECSGKYDDAIIIFDLSQIQDARVFVETLQHELIHCVVSDMDMVKDAAYIGLSSTEIGMLNSIYADALERTVTRIQRIIFGEENVKVDG